MLNKGQLKRLLDCVQQLPQFKIDIDAGIFARQLVSVTLNELFRHEFAEPKWATGELLPIDGSLSAGATEYSYNEILHTGLAKIVADNATDIPRSEIQGKNNVHPVKTVACAFEYTTQEVRTAMENGMFQIPAEKAQAARTAHDYALHNFIRDGVPTHNLAGITNAPGIIVLTATTGSWASASAVQIVDDFTTGANLIMSLSDGLEVPDSVVFPLPQFLRLSTLQNSAASDITVLEYLMKAFPMITTWTWEAGMDTVGSGSTPAALIYKKDPSKVRAVQPMTLQALAPESDGLTFKVTLESRFGGVMAPKPRSIERLEGI